MDKKNNNNRGKNQASYIKKSSDSLLRNKNKKKHKRNINSMPPSPKPPKLTKEQKQAYHAKIKEEFVPISKQKYKRLTKAQKKIYKYQERVADKKKRVLFYFQRGFLGLFGLCVLTGVVISLLQFFGL